MRGCCNFQHSAVAVGVCLLLVVSSGFLSPAVAGHVSLSDSEPPTPVGPGAEVTEPVSVSSVQVDDSWNSALAFLAGRPRWQYGS